MYDLITQLTGIPGPTGQERLGLDWVDDLVGAGSPPGWLPLLAGQ
jgi:hypothetical protein